MKLYTEEQVIDAINKSFLIEYPSTGNDILNELTPIELPSDEEIINEAEITFNIPDDKIGNVYFCADIAHSRRGFRIGAKWMRDKIQGGNNEQ